MKGLWNLPLLLRKTTELRPAAGKRPLHKTVKVKPAIHWRTQEIGDSRAME